MKSLFDVVEELMLSELDVDLSDDEIQDTATFDANIYMDGQPMYLDKAGYGYDENSLRGASYDKLMSFLVDCSVGSRHYGDKWLEEQDEDIDYDSQPIFEIEIGLSDSPEFLSVAFSNDSDSGCEVFDCDVMPVGKK